MNVNERVEPNERKPGKTDSEEDETPVVIPPSAVTIYPKGTPVPTPGPLRFKCSKREWT